MKLLWSKFDWNTLTCEVEFDSNDFYNFGENMIEQKGGMYAVWSIVGGDSEFPVSIDESFVLKVEGLTDGAKTLKIGTYDLEFVVNGKTILMNTRQIVDRKLTESVEFDQGPGYYEIGSENVLVIGEQVLANAMLARWEHVDETFNRFVEIRWYEQAPEVMLAGFVNTLNILQASMGETVNKEE